MDAAVYSHATIGAMLKAHREEIGISQRDIANILKYRSVNFISMLESGRSSIPLNRIVDVINAYQLGNEMALIIIKFLHPDVWTLFVAALKGNKKLCANPYRLDDAVTKKFIKMLRTHGMDELAKAMEED